MKKQGNMTQSNEQTKSPETNLKGTKIYTFPDKEFKVIFLTLNDLQESTDRKLCKIRKTIHEQNESINKDIEIKKRTE